MELRTRSSYHGLLWGGRVLYVWMMVAHAKCQQDTASRILDLATEVEQAFDTVDDDAFAAAARELDAAIVCVRSPLTANTLTRWHRAHALIAFWEREIIASGKSWAAVKVLDPSFTPPASWMPDGSPLRTAWESAPMGAGRIVLERVPAGGWFVDGQQTQATPTERGFILQGFDAAGAVVHTGYHYSVASVPTVDFVALDPTVQQLRRQRVHLAGTVLGATVAAAGVGVALLAKSQRTAALSADTLPADTRDHAERTNRLSNTAVGLGLTSAAILTTTWAVRW